MAGCARQRAGPLLLPGAIAPGFAVFNGLKTAYLSHDPVVEAACKKEPLVHSKISASAAASMPV
jgi:alpha-beta hydrolase superfamily lysophospholipase